MHTTMFHFTWVPGTLTRVLILALPADPAHWPVMDIGRLRPVYLLVHSCSGPVLRGGDPEPSEVVPTAQVGRGLQRALGDQ